MRPARDTHLGEGVGQGEGAGQGAGGEEGERIRYAQAGITRTTAVRAQALRGADEALRWLRRGEGAE